MNRSENITDLVTALAIAQGQITGALKDSDNPFFSSKYADLAACWDVARKPLSENGLSIVQTTERGKPVTIEWETKNEKTGEVTTYKVDTEELIVVTTLFHSSGQWISSELPMIPRDASPQGMGSALTYGRRYGLCPLIGIAQVDDDGNQASGRNGNGAVKGVHSPKGDMGKNVHPDLAFKASVKMHELLEEDVHEDVKCLHIADYSDVLNKDPDLYIAAADLLKPAERSAWKTYCSMAKKRQAAEPTGRRF